MATPTGTVVFPISQEYGAVKVSVTSTSRTQGQKAAGRGKAKTKKSGPEPLRVTIVLTFFSHQWDDIDGAQNFLNAIDPNDPQNGGGPFDMRYPDFNRRGGKSVDIKSIGPVEWRGQIGTCTVEAEEWVPEPPKTNTGQGTTTPDKAAEAVPGDGANGREVGTNGALIARKGIAASATAISQPVRQAAYRGFDGPTRPGSKP